MFAFKITHMRDQMDLQRTPPELTDKVFRMYRIVSFILIVIHIYKASFELFI